MGRSKGRSSGLTLNKAKTNINPGVPHAPEDGREKVSLADFFGSGSAYLWAHFRPKTRATESISETPSRGLLFSRAPFFRHAPHPCRTQAEIPALNAPQAVAPQAAAPQTGAPRAMASRRAAGPEALRSGRKAALETAPLVEAHMAGTQMAGTRMGETGLAAFRCRRPRKQQKTSWKDAAGSFNSCADGFEEKTPGRARDGAKPPLAIQVGRRGASRPARRPCRSPRGSKPAPGRSEMLLPRGIGREKSPNLHPRVLTPRGSDFVY